MSTLSLEEKVNRVIRFLEYIHGPDVLNEHGEIKPKPSEGFVKPGGWGASDDPTSWKLTNMRDKPALFKVTDSAGKNVATDFSSKQTAQQYIDYHKSIYDEEKPEPEEPEPEPEPEQPTPEGSSTTKDGVIVPVAIKGAWKYTVKEDWRDGGARFNMPGAGTSNVMVGYFTATEDGGDEVSAKDLMGRHTGSAGDPESYMGCGYDLGCPVGGGKPRMRAECPHPKYTSTLKDTEFVGNALSFVGKWRGMMLVCQQESTGVRLVWYQDQGDNETKPANKWVKIYEYLDDGKIKKLSGGGFEGDIFPIKNLDHTKGTAQCVWRIDETPGLKQKWLAVAEINRAQ